MQLLHAIPAFALAAFLIVIIPGQGQAMVLRQTLVGGRAVGWFSVLGNSSGLVIWGALAAGGLAAVFAASPTAYQVLKYIGVAYLGSIGLKTLRDYFAGRHKFGDGDTASNQSLAAAFRTGLITNLTNAKAGVFAVAIVPRFVPDGVSVALAVFVLCVVWAVVSLSWYSVLVFAIDKTSHLLTSDAARKRLTLISGLGILFLAAGLALS